MSFADTSLSFASAEINKSLTAEEKKKLYTDMLRVRRFEERSVKAYQHGKIGGFCHTYIGQEAVAIGSISVLGPDDHVITAYRNHAHGIAVGMPLKSLMAELYGKVTGCSKGKGGSMHFFDPSRNYWGGHGIVGGQTPLGLGIAFALKYQDKKGACLCYLGDGAVNQGVFYESLNMASLWDIPVIYIIENNQYSMGTSQARSSAGQHLYERAFGFGMHAESLEGNDLYQVRAKTSEALQRAYTQSKPTLLEIKTYRYRGHSMSDPDQTYRSKEEIEHYKKQQDPISLFEAVLKEEGILSQEAVEAIDTAARQEVEEAAEFAENSPFGEKSSLHEDVYWETDHPEHRQSQGVLFF